MPALFLCPFAVYRRRRGLFFYTKRFLKMLKKKPLINSVSGSSRRLPDLREVLTLENGIALSYFMFKTLSTVKKLADGEITASDLEAMEDGNNEL